jgi:hypothetical protein
MASDVTPIAGLSISPRTVVLSPTQRQQFTASAPGVIWLVDSLAGGSVSSGTITTAGLYSPPNAAGSHIVTVTTSDQLQSSSATVYVSNYPGTFTHHNDNFRTGQNVNETVLTPANVALASFGKLLSYPINGIAHASPLYVASVNVPGQGFHNVVYVATEHDTVYAFDADGLSASPLWQVSFINPAAGVTTIPAGDTNTAGGCCDLSPEVGITGTPVIDQGSGTLYVAAATKEVVGATTSYVQRLHALDITTGAEKSSGPVVIQASVPGNGSGAIGGQVPFDALREGQRPALLLNNGVVYLGFGGHDDQPPYHGWVLGYNASTLQQVMAYNVTANGNAGGIWQSGGGLAADSAAAIYYATGNGPFDANTGGVDYGDSALKLSPGGVVLDYFTPYDQANMDINDFDLASGGVLLLPDQSGAHPHLLISAGKSGTIYLIDRDNMGHYKSNNDSQIVQSLVNIFPHGSNASGNYSAPVYFNGHVYFSPVADTVQAFALNNGLLSTALTSQSSKTYVYPGGSLAISANGNSNGVLWAVERNATTDSDLDATGPGVLHAYDANNLGNELYNSELAGSRDTLMDPAAKFTIPLVANGKVFVASVGRLTVYGLLP